MQELAKGSKSCVRYRKSHYLASGTPRGLFVRYRTNSHLRYIGYSSGNIFSNGNRRNDSGIGVIGIGMIEFLMCHKF